MRFETISEQKGDETKPTCPTNGPLNAHFWSKRTVTIFSVSFNRTALPLDLCAGFFVRFVGTVFELSLCELFLVCTLRGQLRGLLCGGPLDILGGALLDC